MSAAIFALDFLFLFLRQAMVSGCRKSRTYYGKAGGIRRGGGVHFTALENGPPDTIIIMK
jgi:hypothetical protein